MKVVEVMNKVMKVMKVMELTKVMKVMKGIVLLTMQKTILKKLSRLRTRLIFIAHPLKYLGLPQHVMYVIEELSKKVKFRSKILTTDEPKT